MTGRSSLKRSAESTSPSRPPNVPGLLLAAVAIACGALKPSLAECPRMCDCKWKGGKESVMCVDANLTKIPRKLDASTQLLELTGSSLGEISRDTFVEAGLLNLQKLFLARCGLKTLHQYAFRKLINLVELDLSQNALAAVPSSSLEAIPGLRELRLSGNPIRTLAADGFTSVPQLVRLDLSSCQVLSIAPRAFAGLENSLEWLKLDGNRLSVVGASAIAGLLGLHGLALAGNPWNCSCDLRPLREWMLQRNVPSSTPPVCKTPTRLASRSWDTLDLDDFACSPSASTRVSAAASTEGGDVTFRCLIKGVPSPQVRWLWRGSRPIANLSGPNPSNPRRLFLVRTSSSESNLTIISAEGRDAGTYVCSAENRAGKAVANVTLKIGQRPPEDALTARLVAAIMSVAMLLVAASCLVALCVCRLRKQRRGWTLATLRPREPLEDSYEKIEMNHKGSNKSNGSVDLCAVKPLRVPYNRKKNGWYRGVALTDEDEGGYDAEDETPTPTAGHLPSKGSPWTTRTKNFCDAPWMQRPGSLQRVDVHGVRERELSPGPASRQSCINDSVADAVAAGLPQHVLKKQVLSGSAGSLYTSLLSGSAERSISDYNVISPLHQDLPPQAASASNEPSGFFSLPRRDRKSTGGGTYHQPMYGSESPLLPDSWYGSSGGSSTSSHRAGVELPSISSGSSVYYPRASSLLSLPSPSDKGTFRGRTAPSFPGSPSSSSIVETPILNALGHGASAPPAHRIPCSSGSIDSTDNYEGRTFQLDKFLDNYQTLHYQLSKIKESYDTIGRAGNFSHVPKSILKNSKNTLLSPEEPVSYRRNFPPYWLPREALMRRISGNDTFES